MASHRIEKSAESRERAVFLDRDNTLIHNDGDLGDPQRVQMIDGAARAMALLGGLGYRIIVVSNQGGVARGKYMESDVDRVHERIADLVRGESGATIDRFYFCPFHPQATVERYRREHPWRKPNPGMLLQAAEDFGLELGKCWMIGDQPRDVEAGHTVGTRTILIAGPASAGASSVPPDFTARTIAEAAQIIAREDHDPGSL